MKTKKTQTKNCIYYYGYTKASDKSRGGSRQIYRIMRGSTVHRWSVSQNEWQSCRRTAKDVRRDLPARTHSLHEARNWAECAPSIGKPYSTAYDRLPRYRFWMQDRETGRLDVLVGTNGFVTMKLCQSALRDVILGQ